ncbi:MAG TPA: 4'-phosphopantetheinyl transferase superfamily protein [Pyrinomonadaceae bacterium]|nr:4'-phosphopantetheinyl transferase superfamily protein [Pyrinomonadaceae bacterium]
MNKFSSQDSASSFPDGPDHSTRSADLPRLELSADDVHVWLAKLDDYSADSLKLLLREDELLRAARFHFEKDRNHFVVARAWLRKLLGAYLGVSPREPGFSYAEKGKPALEDGQGSSLSFNLAHSGGMAIYAFSRHREIGVDLEFIREDLAGEKIAERFFSEREIDDLKSLPPELRKRAFFDCWTRKEAYIKARGDGLSMPLNEFDVSFVPGSDASLLRNHKEPEEVNRWMMQQVEAPEGYVAALVAEGQDWQLKNFTMDQFPK